MKSFFAVTRMALRSGGGVVSTGGMAAFFAVLVASLFGIALAPMPDTITLAGPAVIWLCVLLSATLSLEAVWHRPLSDGRIDILLLSGVDALSLTTATMLAHWLLTGLPLVLAGCVLAGVFALPAAVLPVVVLSLVCATLYLSATGALAAILTHGARQPGILMVVLILPVQLPMLLLALMASERALLDPSVLNPYVYLQVALVLFALPLVCGGAAWVMRFQLSR